MMENSAVFLKKLNIKLPCNLTFQVALEVKKPPANAEDVRDMGLIPGLGRSSGGGHGNSLQYSCLENPMNRGAWWAIIHGVTKIRVHLSRHDLGISLGS